MTARRALIDEAVNDFDTLPARAARRAAADDSVLNVMSIDLSSVETARRAVDMTVPAVEQTLTDPIRLSADNAGLSGRARKLMATAATMAAAAVFVVPGALQVSSAADRPQATTATLTGDRTADKVTRATERTLLDVTETASDRAVDDDTETRVTAAFEKKAADDKAAEEKAAEEAAAQDRAREEADARRAEATNNAATPAAARPVTYSSAPASGAAGAAVAFALAQSGKPYIWGSTGPAGYDCSGLIYAAYASAGVSLPRTSFGMATAGVAVSTSDLQPGDIIISYGGGHAALYIGNGQVVEASAPGIPIGVNALAGGITAARRVI
ncbi:C40 family peptidase [Propionimicrobium lymphophilum]|uniref:C40 family peptidase n=1 Tax=Propionimicrobium lymphophilum TaxID=33012 RepID=UPI00254E7AAE|nr:C40 family peptidase [Propionimicrobium lymphophilum]MDK7708929.1 C40 family peptidase [Propionimicrobium lymphophilum]MDK7733124.1 C40 family peptidase [Propionimicrobium lymphophilum]